MIVLPFEGSVLRVMSAMLARAYAAMDQPFAVEVHPRRPQDAGAPDPVMREALQRGRVLYEAAA